MALWTGGCSSGDPGQNGGTGGTPSTGSGGQTSTGRGGSTTGGTTGGAGHVGTGGSVATGGTTGSGGQPGTGGGAGGTTGGAGGSTGGAGGRSSTGGSTGNGGTAGGGAGRSGQGGRGTGGSIATGGTGGAGSQAVGATPPMGWNSWNTFGCNPSETLVKGIADAMVSNGMAAVGYQYVNIDDCWMSGRDGSGNLQWDTSKFPSGIPALATYVHGKGLKLGIYETPSAKTCAGKTGGQGHESQDAMSYASWGVDYLKYDDCGGALSSFTTMHNALVATGKPIFYSINPVYGAGSCVPPTCSVDELKVCNMWRIGFDINASWGSFTGLIDTDKPLAQYAGPGHWNDPDMLEVGRGMSADEDRSHFGMWAILAAPLIAGNDIRSMSATTKAILTNADVIAVDQDPLGKQGTLVATPGSNLQVWSKQMSGTNVRAVALFNRSGAAASMSVTWSQIGLPAGAATVRDLYAQKDLGSFNDSYMAASVPSHGIVMLKISSAP
ncbi:MAG TPA: glycoside hydrolase family 27 protein [Polyangia bacterium]|nr:glycoside hydrolase family 27 protein [Polyangia bacterium]